MAVVAVCSVSGVPKQVLRRPGKYVPKQKDSDLFFWETTTAHVKWDLTCGRENTGQFPALSQPMHEVFCRRS